jgi:HSP20 family protein
MGSRNPTAWMWAQACDLMDQAEHMHRQFFRLAASGRTRAVWEPPADVFEDEREIVVIIALPGVQVEGIEIRFESGTLMVRAERRIPFAGSRRSVRRLEIPYGCFERRIALPAAQYEIGQRELVDGCLMLKLRKVRYI